MRSVGFPGLGRGAGSLATSERRSRPCPPRRAALAGAHPAGAAAGRAGAVRPAPGNAAPGPGPGSLCYVAPGASQAPGTRAAAAPRYPAPSQRSPDPPPRPAPPSRSRNHTSSQVLGLPAYSSPSGGLSSAETRMVMTPPASHPQGRRPRAGPGLAQAGRGFSGICTGKQLPHGATGRPALPLPRIRGITLWGYLWL